MRIDFTKNVPAETLTRYTSLSEPFCANYPHFGAAMRRLTYDISALERDAMDTLESNFRSGGFSPQRTKFNALWVAKDTPFSLRLDGFLPHSFGSDASRVQTRTYELRQQGHASVTVPGFLYGSRVIRAPCFFEKPIDVELKGQLTFEQLSGVDPSAINLVLQGAGYDAEVITTPQEIVEAFQRLAQSKKRRKEDGSYRLSSDDLGSQVAAAAVMSALD